MSRGNSPASSQSWECGAISRSANSRTSLRSSSCWGVKKLSYIPDSSQERCSATRDTEDLARLTGRRNLSPSLARHLRHRFDQLTVVGRLGAIGQIERVFEAR